MKLPQDKKERQKVFIALGLGAAFVLYGLYAGVLTPLLNKRAEFTAKKDALGKDLEKANRAIRKIDADQTLKTETLRRIRADAEKYFLKPRHGEENFLFDATEKVEAIGKRAGIVIEPDTVREPASSQIPQTPRRKTDNVIKAFSVRVSFSGGYADIVRFVREAETSNPYLSIVSLAIGGRPPPDEDRHSVNMVLQWPVWDRPEVIAKLEAPPTPESAPAAKPAKGKKGGQE